VFCSSQRPSSQRCGSTMRSAGALLRIRELCLSRAQVQSVCSRHCSECSAGWTFTFLIGLIPVCAALQAKGLQKVEMDANPGLLVAFRVGNKQVYVLQHIAKDPIVKRGTLAVELADPQLNKVVWWGVGEDTLTDNRGKDLPMIQRAIAKMFKKYPPPKSELVA
jgi:hypothetical protein